MRQFKPKFRVGEKVAVSYSTYKISFTVITGVIWWLDGNSYLYNAANCPERYHIDEKDIRKVTERETKNFYITYNNQ